MRFFRLFWLLALGLNFATGADFVIERGQILNSAVSQKIGKIGAELLEKTKIYAGIAVYENLGGKSLSDTVKELNLKPPYALIALAKAEQKLEIYADASTLELFDKEQILSPFPERGTILPILTSKKGDVYNAALLNGYADLVEQIAASKGVVLQNAIGSANKTTLNLLRLGLYGFMAGVILFLFWRKFKAKNG